MLLLGPSSPSCEKINKGKIPLNDRRRWGIRVQVPPSVSASVNLHHGACEGLHHLQQTTRVHQYCCGKARNLAAAIDLLWFLFLGGCARFWVRSIRAASCPPATESLLPPSNGFLLSATLMSGGPTHGTYIDLIKTLPGWLLWP